MLRILSDLTITSRVDVPNVKSGDAVFQGSWVAIDSSGDYRTNFTGGVVPMGCVFNMYDAGNTALSADTAAIRYESSTKSSYGGAGKVTLITGPFRGVTDQIQSTWAGGTAAAGDALTVISGVLAKATTNNHVVAVLEEIVSNFEHRGEVYGTAWRFKTV